MCLCLGSNCISVVKGFVLKSIGHNNGSEEFHMTIFLKCIAFYYYYYCYFRGQILSTFVNCMHGFTVFQVHIFFLYDRLQR